MVPYFQDLFQVTCGEILLPLEFEASQNVINNFSIHFETAKFPESVRRGSCF